MPKSFVGVFFRKFLEKSSVLQANDEKASSIKFFKKPFVRMELPPHPPFPLKPSVPEWTCILCGNISTTAGNNPEPFANLSEGLCCDDCNKSRVLPARFHHLFGGTVDSDLEDETSFQEQVLKKEKDLVENFETLDMGEKPLTRVQVNAEESLKLAELVSRVKEDVNFLTDTVLRLQKENCELKDFAEMMYFKHYTMKQSPNS